DNLSFYNVQCELKCSNLPIEINLFTLAIQNKKQAVADNKNYSELVSDLGSQNESKIDSNNEIKSIKHPRLTKKNLKWNPNWLQFYLWLRAESPINPSILFCKWCEKAKFNNIFTEDTSWFKEQYLIWYLNSKNH
ncbi:7684_t:CDS:2, partial [Racocetra fulgida]